SRPVLRSAPSSILLFHRTAPPEIYTLSLHDALPIFGPRVLRVAAAQLGPYALVPVPPERGQIGGHRGRPPRRGEQMHQERHTGRSEEHTSELQSRENLVCRLLLEKKKTRR